MITLGSNRNMFKANSYETLKTGRFKVGFRPLIQSVSVLGMFLFTIQSIVISMISYWLILKSMPTEWPTSTIPLLWTSILVAQLLFGCSLVVLLKLQSLKLFRTPWFLLNVLSFILLAVIYLFSLYLDLPNPYAISIAFSAMVSCLWFVDIVALKFLLKLKSKSGVYVSKKS